MTSPSERTIAGEGFDCPRALGEILARVRGELVDLSHCAEDLQVTIGAIADGGSSELGPGTQIRLQAADALTQRLERLAQLVLCLEAEILPTWRLEHGVTPGDELYRAIERLCRSGDPANHPGREGECEFF